MCGEIEPHLINAINELLVNTGADSEQWMSKTKTKRPNQKPSNRLRIIGGQWRGRKLSFPTIEGLRPTPDRVRETLFNWLAADIIDTRCLDLFAGSGALGLEALSRGAGFADLVDNSAEAAKQLQQHLQLLNADNGQVSLDNAEHKLQQHSGEPYDIIFLDPPFHQQLAASCIQLIDQRNLLSTRGWVYLEMASDEPLPIIPTHWRLHRQKSAGQVCYRLFANH